MRGGLSGAMLICIALGLTATTAPAQNSQPISTSLAECSVIFGELADLGARRNREEELIASTLIASERFFEAAVHQSRSEGISDAASHVAALCGEKSEKWHNRFSSLLKLRENREWIDYCKALGEELQILPVVN